MQVRYSFKMPKRAGYTLTAYSPAAQTHPLANPLGIVKRVSDDLAAPVAGLRRKPASGGKDPLLHHSTLDDHP